MPRLNLVAAMACVVTGVSLLSGCSSTPDPAPAPSPVTTPREAVVDEKTGEETLCVGTQDFPTLPAAVTKEYSAEQARLGGCWAVDFAADYTYTELMGKASPKAQDFEFLNRHLSANGKKNLATYVAEFAKKPNVTTAAWQHLEALSSTALVRQGESSDTRIGYTFDALATPAPATFTVVPTDIAVDRGGHGATSRLAVTMKTTATIPMLNTTTKTYDVWDYQRTSTYWLQMGATDKDWVIDEWAAALKASPGRTNLSAEQAGLKTIEN